MNALGLDVTGVGNHEFDEGVNELLRMQFGGCHPVDGCQDGDGFAGAVFKYLAANVFYAGTNETIFPPYRVDEDRQREDRVHRADARGHADDRDAVGRRRPRVPARGCDGQRARREAPERAGRQGVRRAPPPGRLPEPTRAGVPGAREPAGCLYGREQCVNFSGAEITGDRERPRSAGQGRGQRAHACAVHLHDRRQARHERVVVRPLDHVHRPHASTTSRSDRRRRRPRTTS